MTPGFFGKLPAKGDFIQRGLSPSFTGPWDNWLQSCMEHSRASLGENWLNTYLVSPLWRFCLAPKLLSDNAMVGVVMPSVDSVGRYFPLTIVAEIPATADLLMFAQEQDQWFEKIEQIALYGLSKEFDLDAFNQHLEGAVVSALPVAAKALPAAEHRIGWQSQADSGALAISAASAQLFSQQYLANSQIYSLWWTLGSEKVEPTFMIYQGLPPVQDYQSMISGEWQHG